MRIGYRIRSTLTVVGNCVREFEVGALNLRVDSLSMFESRMKCTAIIDGTTRDHF